MHISITAETIAEIFGYHLTNSIFTSLLISAVVVVLAIWAKPRLREIPSKTQALIEVVISAMYNLTESVAGKNTREFFPLVMTFFIFILLSNWFGLIPGISAIGFNTIEHGEEVFVPIFRAATADLNTTLALAVIAMVAVQYFAVKHIGLKIHLGKFFNFSSPIDFFVGILELVGEFSKIISFAFRLFGNVFAGEVLLIVIAGLIPILAPVPFLGLEIFVGFIQAAVFAILALVFFSSAVEHH